MHTHTHTPLCGQLQWSAVYCVTTTSGKKYIMELLLQFVFAPWAPPLCSGDIYRAKLFWSLVTSQVTLHMQRNINWKTTFNIPLMINFFWAPNSCKTTLSLLYLLLYAYFCTWQYFSPPDNPWHISRYADYCNALFTCCTNVSVDLDRAY